MPFETEELITATECTIDFSVDSVVVTSCVSDHTTSLFTLSERTQAVSIAREELVSWIYYFERFVEAVKAKFGLQGVMTYAAMSYKLKWDTIQSVKTAELVFVLSGVENKVKLDELGMFELKPRDMLVMSIVQVLWILTTYKDFVETTRRLL